jgi:hypothetical protein
LESPTDFEVPMHRFDHAGFRLGRLSWWQTALVVALAAATVIAIAIVATSLILIIAPIVLVAVLLHRLLGPRPTGRDEPPRRRPTVIEADYEVIADVRPADRRRPDSGEEPRHPD